MLGTTNVGLPSNTVFVKRIQRGTASINANGGTSVTVNIDEVNLDKAILICDSNASSGSNPGYVAIGELSANSITFTRQANGAIVTGIVWQVIEFN